MNIDQKIAAKSPYRFGPTGAEWHTESSRQAITIHIKIETTTKQG